MLDNNTKQNTMYCLTVEEIPRKNLNQEIWPDLESNLGLLCGRQRYHRYGQRFRRVRYVNERFKASFLPMWHMTDINNHFVSDCTREVRTEGSRGKCTCFTPNAFSITGTVSIRHVSECVPGVLSIYIFRYDAGGSRPLSDSYFLT